MVEMKSEKPTVAIIGAGVSGICTSIELQKKLGITASLFEMEDDIGGTWKQNTYPGCSCDLPSHIYVLSSDLNPDWSTTYSSQLEILEYFKNVAKKHGIYQHTRFKTEIIQAVWIEEKKQWRLDLRDKRPSANDDIETVYFDILFSGVGSLRIINVPSEFKTFKGKVVHTGAWDNTIDFKDKRVALVGSGSSAIQTLPYLTEHASKVICYQRSAPWILPRPQTVYPEFVKWIFRNIPLIMLLYRWYLYLTLDLVYLTFGYPDSFLSKRLNKNMNDSRVKELTQLGRPDLIEKLKPTYRLGCKRVVFSSEFHEAIAKPNVLLNQSPIKNIMDKTIVTEDGATEEVDILVLGTGFQTQQGVLGDIEIIGNEGQSLTELWKHDLPQLYKSTIINGFPNMFMLLGPTTILGHHSVLLMIETQVSFAVNAIRKLIIERNMSAIEPTLEAQAAHMAQLRSDLKGTIWTTACNSWYKNESGEVTNIYPNSVTRFKYTLGKINEEDYVDYPVRALE
ncbi:putative flavin-binding monooxygenase-like protein [Parasitella parasitica]|nr:putative flavin-binding monooxygenase-like protein [Parasitella parasitica]